MEHFLETLETQLNILDEKEQKKIIKRYQKEIEEKIEAGMSEEEAIQSLGNLDNIVSDIYEQYHLDNKNRENRSSFGERLNRGIRKCANFLADTCTEISYYLTHASNSALETFFEIFLKILVLILAILLLKFPILIIEHFFKFILGFLFYPFNRVLIGIFEFSLSVIYLLVSICLGFLLFKEYAFKKTPKEQVKEPKKKIKSSETTRNYAYLFLKIFLYLIFIIPMIFISLVLLLLTALALFVVYKGVSIIGLVVVLVGLLFLSIVVTVYITDALDNRIRSHTLAIIVTIISLISGSILLIDNIMNFHYPKELEDSSFVARITTKTLNIEKETTLVNANGNIQFIVDNSVADNQILVEASYFNELYEFIIKEGNDDFIWFYTMANEFELADVHYLYKNIFQDLKNNNIYNYQNLKKASVIIYGNEKTEKLLKIEQ